MNLLSFLCGLFTIFCVQTSTIEEPFIIEGNLGSDLRIQTVPQGGTGWENIQANSIIFGNGTSRLATTSAGTNGYVLALQGGVPTWTATSSITGTNEWSFDITYGRNTLTPTSTIPVWFKDSVYASSTAFIDGELTVNGVGTSTFV